MDKDRIHTAALGRRPSPNREKRRLIVYAVVLGLLLIFWTRSRESEADTAGSNPVQAPFAPREYVPLSKIDPERLAAVHDGERVERAVLEADAHQHLMSEAGKLVYGDMEALGVTAVEWDALTADTDAYRGRPVTALGRLAWWEVDTSTDPVTFRGELVDEQGHSWPLLVLHMPLAAHPDDVMRIKGFFFKHYDMVRPDLTRASGPLIVGEELLPSSFPIEPVAELRDDLFEGLRDHDLGEASRPLDGPAFFELLSYVQNTDADELLGPVAEREPVYARELLNDTPTWRGKPVTTRGQLVQYQRMPLGPEGENPLGVPFAWQVWVLNYRGGITYAITLEEPVGLVREKDMVDVDGIYFRRYAYESGRNEPAMAAAVIAKQIRRFEIPPDTLTPFIEKLVLVAVIALTLLIGIGQWNMSRQGRRARTASIRRKRKLLDLPGTLNKPKGDTEPEPKPNNDNTEPDPNPSDDDDTAQLGSVTPRPGASGPS